MPQTQIGVVLRHLHRLLGTPSLAEPTDGQLLDRFDVHHDEAAFEELLCRHGPMVLGVCRRLLHAKHDADDVFQATFLVFVHKAKSIRKGTAVGSWLYGVAYRLALKARAGASRRRLHERRVANMRSIQVTSEQSWDDLRPILDEELARLPERLRAPLVLCDLEGKTHAEAARELGWAAGSLSKLLARGRELLRQRLTRRGIALSSVALGLALAEHAAAAVPLTLGRATLAAGLAVQAGAGLVGFVSSRVANLVQFGVRDLALAKGKLVLALLVALGALGLGAGLLNGPSPEPKAAAADDAKVEAQPRPGFDLYGDPLPAGALVRLGSTHLRQGHNAQTVAFAPDGKTLVSTGSDHLARQWDVTNGHQVGSFGQGDDRDKPYAPTRWLHAVAFAPDGKTLATGDHNNGWKVSTIRIWDTATRKQLRVLEGHTDGVLCLAYSPDGKTLASASADGTVRLWDPDKGTERASFTGHEGAVRSVAWRKDGKQFASTGADGAIRLWDPDKGTAVHSFKAHTAGGNGVVYAPDGQHVVSVGGDKLLRLWDISRVPCPEVHRRECWKAIRALDCSANGKLVACGSGDDVLLWDPATGKDIRLLKGPHNEITSIAFSPDGKHVAATALVHTAVFLWDTASGKRLCDDAGHDGAQVGRLEYSADGRVLTSCCADWTLRQWDAATGRQLRRIELRQPGSHGAALAPDGKSLAAGTWAGNLRICDREGKELRSWKAHAGKPGATWVTAVAYSPDGKTLASTGSDRAVVLWDPATGHELRRFTVEGEGEYPSDVIFSPNGRWLAAIARGQPVAVWDLTTGKPRELIRPVHGGVGGVGNQAGGNIESAAFSPDSRLLATGGRDNTARLWDLATGQQLREFPGHPGWIQAVAFSRDGRTLAVSHWRSVRLWEVSTGKERRRFTGHEGDGTSLAFAPNGRTLASGSTDTTALIWDLTGRLDQGKLRPANLTPPDLESAWTALRGDEAGPAYRAIWTLAASPRQALPLLRGLLKPAQPADAGQLAKLIAALDDDDFEKRDSATNELAKLGEQAEPALRKALAAKPTAEPRRRIEFLLERLKSGTDSGERLQLARALELVEDMGTPEARTLLVELSRGAAEAWLTREAKGAQERLAADRRSAR